MSQIKKIAIVWESETGGGVNSYLRYLLQSKAFLSKQITIGLKGINKKSEIFVAYEPIWAIGTGLVPNTSNLKKNLKFIQTKLKKILNNYKILYGGSVNHKTVKAISSIGNVDGFLIGGASQSSKKFIDIIKNSYK